MCEVLSSDSPTDRTVFVHDASSGGEGRFRFITDYKTLFFHICLLILKSGTKIQRRKITQNKLW